MKALAKLAAEAAEELKSGKVGRSCQKFTDTLNHTIPPGAKKIDLGEWRKVSHALGEDFPNDETLCYWLYGIGGQASLLMVKEQHQIDPQMLTKNVLAFCGAIKKVAKSKRKRTRKPKS